MTEHWLEWRDVRSFVMAYSDILGADDGARIRSCFDRLQDFPAPFQRYVHDVLRHHQSPPAERGKMPKLLSVWTQIDAAKPWDRLESATQKVLRSDRHRWEITGEAFARDLSAAWTGLTRAVVAQLSVGAIEGRGVLDGTPPGKFAVSKPIPTNWWGRAQIYSNPSCAASGPQFVRNLELRFALSVTPRARQRGPIDTDEPCRTGRKTHRQSVREALDKRLEADASTATADTGVLLKYVRNTLQFPKGTDGTDDQTLKRHIRHWKQDIKISKLGF